jgi:hypothetical protein
LTYQKNPEVLNGALDDVYITTRTLDDLNALPPTEHVYYGSRPGWLVVNDGLPRHEQLSQAHAHRQLASPLKRP